MAVDKPGVEPEILQPGLQCRDVVAVHRRTELVIECARAQAVRSFFERTESRLADDAVDQQSAVLLERADSVVEFVVKHLQGDVPTGGQVVVGVVDHPQRRQCRPDLGDRSPADAETQTRHTRPFSHGCQQANGADEASTGYAGLSQTVPTFEKTPGGCPACGSWP